MAKLKTLKELEKKLCPIWKEREIVGGAGMIEILTEKRAKKLTEKSAQKKVVNAIRKEAIKWVKEIGNSFNLETSTELEIAVGTAKMTVLIDFFDLKKEDLK